MLIKNTYEEITDSVVPQGENWHIKKIVATSYEFERFTLKVAGLNPFEFHILNFKMELNKFLTVECDITLNAGTNFKLDFNTTVYGEVLFLMDKEILL